MLVLVCWFFLHNIEILLSLLLVINIIKLKEIEGYLLQKKKQEEIINCILFIYNIIITYDSVYPGYLWIRIGFGCTEFIFYLEKKD